MMTLAPGTRLGPYEILAPLGAGGMGEVYRARDTRLDRDVAVKILPPHFAQDPDRLARFEREAKAVAALSHPNILAIHDFGRHDGTTYAVMELLEGNTLRERLAGGALPQRKAVEYAAQIASGLAAAHDKGIVHRDLKPDNLFVTSDARVKILDFGLAALVEAAPEDLSQSPTRERPTDPGTVLGAAGYMSPEQARGQKADARSDVFSLGCVLYEMVSGKRAFRRETTAETLTAILREDPPSLSEVAPPVSASLERMLLHCLEKRPEDRFQSARDLAFDLQAMSEPSGIPRMTTPGRGPKSRRDALAWALAAMGLVVGVAGFWTARLSARQPPNSPEPVVTHILPPSGSVNTFLAGFAVSPDGRQVAFSSLSSKGERLLWVRSLNRAESQPLAGTNGANRPFWSTDGKNIAFVAGDKLKRVAAEGGAVQEIGRAYLWGFGASWCSDGSIVREAFVRGLDRVDSSGRNPMTVVPSRLKGRFPFCLPDGKRFLYDWNGELFVGPTDPQLPRAAIAGLVGVEHVEFAAPDRLVFLDHAARTLYAQRVDLERGRAVGARQAIAENVPYPGAWPAFSLSRSGALAYLVNPPEARNDFASRMQWVDRSGQALGNVGPVGGYFYTRVSPDGNRIAVNPDDDVWVFDASKGLPTRVTSASRSSNTGAYGPVWGPMGDRLAFLVLSADGTSIEEKSLKSGAQKTLAKQAGSPTGWSPDGRYLALDAGESSNDITLLDLSESRTIPFLVTEFNEASGVFSPDGRYLAYQSDETGAFEVYLRPFPGPGPARRVSSAGGQHPRWRADGRELFYVTSDWTIMATPVRTQPALEVGSPAPLFRMVMADLLMGLISPYDFSPDGKRFLVNVPQGAPVPLTLVQNWTALLDR